MLCSCHPVPQRPTCITSALRLALQQPRKPLGERPSRSAGRLPRLCSLAWHDKEYCMAERDRPQRPERSLPSSDLPPARMRETTVPIVPTAPTPPQRRRLGPRHMVPPVPEGPDVPDNPPSPPATITSVAQ